MRLNRMLKDEGVIHIMKKNKRIPAILVMMLLFTGTSQPATAQQRVSGSNKTDSSADAVTRVNSSTLLARLWRGGLPRPSLMPSRRYGSPSTVAMASLDSAVHGSGAVGAIPMWTDVRPNGDATLGDSIITQGYSPA